jgi:hypothetical protein
VTGSDSLAAGSYCLPETQSTIVNRYRRTRVDGKANTLQTRRKPRHQQAVLKRSAGQTNHTNTMG